jgi:N-acetyl-anhydromuramyl-L-alanine amidase AmpD
MGKYKGIVCHWTGGTYIPNTTDKTHYHFLIDGKGKVVEGKYRPSDNLDCSDGKYAAHCGGGNTGRIGVALCGMWSKDYPIKRIQLEAMCKLVAQLSKEYNIPINSDSILTHSEFGHKNPSTTSFGKVDIDKLPCIALYTRNDCGNWIRNKVNWYRQRL